MRIHHSQTVLVLFVSYLSLLLIGSSEGLAPSRITNFCIHDDRSVCHRPAANLKPMGTQQHHTRSSTATLMIRGGAALPVSKPIVAKVSTGFLALNGVSLLVAPIAFLKRMYKIDIEKESLEVYLLRAIGAISIGGSINVYLSLVKHMAAQRAIGFSLLARFVYVLKSSLIGKDLVELGGSKQFLSTNEVLMAWTTFSLLTGAGNPILSAKIFSCLAFLKGSFLVLNPVAAANKFLGIDVSKEGMEKSKGLCRSLGNELTTSALLMGTLAFGVEPFKAAGYTCLLWVLLLADMSFRDKTYLLLGESSPKSLLANLVISALFALGFLA